ncbi:putative lipid II flippase FtsW [Solemya pervernicosa gill symbiont]|uniref:Probable peptidoglycan glycosyltransferase FtsW n=2 Tax=Gammaproteobacteria incertae sedis TaxID=118884 RepID=A0A1T2L9Q2_9GAMM|nr:putative lipid II flippase FtsW [Candidatus Reidiella endopervernicosa]OOZ41848.1 putative lipid II flippase FtsW [Solemya pervernicosa gill symbiont]QKQ26198.1 putative lipid II flippase FtsW [Candidatus Reidiella endopervernicosa]
MSAVAATAGQASRAAVKRKPAEYDFWLLGTVFTLAALGLVMVGSASIAYADRFYDTPFHFLFRQSVYMIVALLSGYLVVKTPMVQWERASMALLVGALLLLMVVLIPGVGREVNGAVRWLPLGVINMQVSELAKLFVIIYLAGYLVRRGHDVRNTAKGFFVPMGVLSFTALLLLLEPDFGTTVVLMAAALGMLFIGGVRLWLFGMWLGVVLAAMVILAVSSPYRMQRITTFLNPWADPFNSGFQLTQALMAIGRGEWFGVGLGASVQKLSYLPEAHTDFLFAVIGEELGFVTVTLVVVLFAFFVWRSFAIAARAEQRGHRFPAYLCYGIALWIGVQAFINMGVNMGLLPTKGLTLPLMSYGGSSLIVTALAIGMVVRTDHELRTTPDEGQIPWGQKS